MRSQVGIIDGAERVERVVFRLFLFLLIFPPLISGAVSTGPSAVMELSAILGLLLFLINAWARNEKIFAVPGILPLSLLLAYLLFQIIPLPIGILKTLSPGTYELYTETMGLLGPVTSASISVHRQSTLSEFVRLSAYGCFYHLTVQLLTRKQYFRKTVKTVSIFAGVLSIPYIFHYILPKDPYYWFSFLGTHDLAFFPLGPYVNRNHYAGFMAMVFPLGLGLFLSLSQRRPEPHGSIRCRLSDLISAPGRNLQFSLAFFLMCMAASVVLSGSRGGTTSLLLSSLCFIFLILMNRRRAGVTVPGTLITTCVMFGLAVIWVGDSGWARIFNRFTSLDPQGNLRWIVWQKSMGIIRDHPVTGTGFGTFARIYPSYGDEWFSRAHNDYIELLTDGGLIAALLCFVFFASVFWKTYGMFSRRRDRYAIKIFMGAMTGIVAILLHSFTDFNLHIPSNGLYFFFLLGVMVSAAHTRFGKRPIATKLKRTAGPPSKKWIAAAGLLFSGCLAFNAGACLNDYYFWDVERGFLFGDMPKEDLPTVVLAASRGTVLDPLEARHHLALAEANHILRGGETSLPFYIKALALDPLNGECLRRMALWMADRGESATADKCFLSGIKRGPAKSGVCTQYGQWALSMGERGKAFAAIKQALAFEVERTPSFETLIKEMEQMGFTDHELLSAMPERVLPHFVLGDHFAGAQREQSAAAACLKGLHYVDREKTITPGLFWKPYGYFMKRKAYPQALEVMDRAVLALPKDVEIRLAAAWLFEVLNMAHRAAEAYEAALRLDPENGKAKTRLAKLQSEADQR